MAQTNSLQHVFTFEDLYKDTDDESNALFQDADKSFELTSFNQDNFNSRVSKSFDDYDKKKKLTKNSKFELFIRIFLFSLMIIYIPLSLIVADDFNKMEVNLIFKPLSNLTPNTTLINLNKNLFLITRIIQDKDFTLGISSALYVLIHPYVSLKLIFASAFFHYIITLIKIIDQPRRPSWENMPFSQRNDIIVCETSFSSPSEGVFFISFFYIYAIYCIRKFYLQNQRMNIILRIILTIIYFGLMALEHFYLLIYKLNYLYEIIFTHMLTLVYICILMDFDSKYHKKLYNATKNIFKTRKNMLKVLLFCSILCFIGILLYNFITPDRMLLRTIEKLYFNIGTCSHDLIENLGMDRTFMNISNIFCMLGAFCGASLNIEFNPGEWWYQPLILDGIEKAKMKRKKINVDSISKKEIGFLILKTIIMIGIYFLIWLGFTSINYITFQFNFFIECLKYLVITFVCFGVLPLLFGFLLMNKRVEDIYDSFKKPDDELKNWSKNLFSATVFVNYQEKARYPYIHLKRN